MGVWSYRYTSSKKRAEGGYDKLAITIDDKGLDIVQDLMDAFPDRVTQSIRRAIHRAGQGGLTEVKESVTQRYNIRKGYVTANVIYKDNKKKKTPDEEILIKSKRLNLAHFSPRPTKIGGRRPKVGLSVMVNREIGRYKIAGAFAANLPQTLDTTTPFRIYCRKGRKRFPVKALYGPSLPQMLNNDDREKVLRVMETRFVKEFHREMTKGFQYGGKK